MITYAKILFYNEQNGSGISITQDKQKIKFSIEEWSNYDVMPSLGLEISFTLKDNQVTNINPDIAKIKNNLNEKIVLTNIQETSKKTVEETNDTTEKTVLNNSTNITIQLNALLNNYTNSPDSLNKKIPLSLDISQTMSSYFDSLKKQLNKREGYHKVSGRLNYSLARRFLWTTFNNLYDIDNEIVTTRIKAISDDLKYFSKIKDSFEKKTKQPLLAFSDIFLNFQKEYKSVQKLTTGARERLNFLINKENTLSIEKKIKKDAIKQTRNKEEIQLLTQELKSINGAYADIVHMMAKLKEINEKNTKRMMAFEEKYRSDFYLNFQIEAKKHQKNITTILDAQAYLLDFLLWKEARNSETTRSYFKSLAVDLELNTKTYLKYYLGTLDETKANQETQDLFDLYTHLEELEKNYVLILTSDAQDAMEYTQSIKSSDNSLVVKAFISELESIKWAMRNRVKAIIVEDLLLTTSAQKYLDYYHSHILSKPKIILIGKQPQKSSTRYSINKVLPSAIQAKQVAKSLCELLKP